MTSSEACGVRLHELRRLDVGELGPDSDVGKHVATCPACATRARMIAADRPAFAAAAPVASAQILARLEAEPAPRWLRLLAPLAAVVSVALFVLVPRIDAPENRVKGSPHLTMFVNRPAGPVEATPGLSLRAGDQIQFRASAGGRRYVYVASIDGRGVITSLVPGGGRLSAPIAPGEQILEGSTVLDDALGRERVFAFFSDEPLAWADVEAKLSSAGDAERVQWDGVEVATTWFEKVP